jgi:hypothetical protein
MQARNLTGAEEAFARALAATVPDGRQTSGAPETRAEQWATEILPLARDAHALKFTVKERKVPEPGKVSCTWTATTAGVVMNDPKDGVPLSYGDWASKRAAEQLTKAGFRLAALLAAVLPR